MEPFSILCSSCAARLRVRQPNLIGQSLGCPKCGGMVQVIPPDDWEPPAELAAEIKQRIKSEAKGFDFDDIDQILKHTDKVSTLTDDDETVKLPPHPTPQTNSPVGSRKSKKKPTGQKPAVVQSGAQPILPTGDWTSQESKKRGKMVMLIAATVGGLLLVIAAIVLISQLGGKSDKPIVKNDDNAATATNQTNTNVKEITSAKNDTNPDAVKTEDSKPTKPPIDNEPNGTPEKTDDNSDPTTPALPPATDDSTASDQNTDEPKNKPMNLIDPGVGINLNDNKSDDKQVIRDPLAGFVPDDDPDAVAANILKNDEGKSQMGEFSDLLAQSGSSLMKLTDLAALHRDLELMGRPKYYVAKPTPIKVNMEQVLASPVGGIVLNKIPMNMVLRDIENATLIPFQIDWQSLYAAGIQCEAETTITTEGSVDEVISRTLALHGLSATKHANGVLIVSTANNNALVNARYELPPVAKNADEIHKKIIQSIKMLFAPASWTRPTDPARIEVVDGVLSIDQSSHTQFFIKQFMDKLNAAAKIKLDPANVTASKVLETSAQSIRAAMDEAHGLKPTVKMSLNEYLTHLEKNCNITVLVDWLELRRLGWDLHTMVPGNMEEETVGGVLKQLAHSMGLTIYVVDDQTIELTSFNAAANRSEIEFYPCGEITKSAVDGSVLRNAIVNTLGGQKTNVLYEPAFECLIVIAPQSMHRQVSAVMDELHRTLKRVAK